MIIQPLVFHNVMIETSNSDLFYRIKNGICTEKGVFLQGDGEISLDTYFNSFSVAKWLRYTSLDNLTLMLYTDQQMRLEIEAFNAVLTDHLVKKEKVSVEIEDAMCCQCVDSEEQSHRQYKVKFSSLPSNGIVFVTCRALTEGTIYGGYYETSIREKQLNNVRIAAGICTFHREAELRRNLYDLEPILEGESAVIPKEKFHVFVSDNGKTLPVQGWKEGIDIIPNCNAGGSGGFARTMIEAMHKGGTSPYTHIIVMDDDIRMPRHAIEVTYALLRLIKPEYMNSICGAAMMQEQIPYLRFESGAYFNLQQYRADVYDRGLDVRELDAVLYGERDKSVNYTGWWFTCIPFSIISKYGLPMPFFIHFDDIEYGLRCCDIEKILLNTISVYHPALVNKAPCWDRYYVRRNSMITEMTEGNGRYLAVMLAGVWKAVLKDLLHFRYEETSYELMAVRDFCKGGRKLLHADIENEHKRLSVEYKPVISPDTPEGCHQRLSKPLRRFDYIRQMIDFILPADGKAIVVDRNCEWLPFRAPVVYEYDTMDNYRVLTRDRGRSAKCLLQLTRYLLLLMYRRKKICSSWLRAKKHMVTERFWKKAISLDD